MSDKWSGIGFDGSRAAHATIWFQRVDGTDYINVSFDGNMHDGIEDVSDLEGWLFFTDWKSMMSGVEVGLDTVLAETIGAQE